MKSGVATQQASDGTIIEGEERKKGAAATATAAAAVPTSHFGMNQKRAPASVTRFPPGGGSGQGEQLPEGGSDPIQILLLGEGWRRRRIRIRMRRRGKKEMGCKGEGGRG